MGCEIQAIKKTSVKTLEVGLYSVFLNVPIKHVQEKEILWEKKKKSLLFQLLFNCNIEKNNNVFLCQLCFLLIYLYWLTPCIFDFLLIGNTHHNH